jgi:hypothetical protein
MRKLMTQVIFSIAIGVLVGVLIGGKKENKKVEYYFHGEEISKERYDYKEMGGNKDIFIKEHFNTDLALYYGAITGASLMIILLLIPSNKKKKDEQST